MNNSYFQTSQKNETNSHGTSGNCNTNVSEKFTGTGIYSMGFISEKGLINLKEYKYKSGLSSYLDKWIMNPFWEWCLDQFMPLWLAPNLITLMSLLHAFIAYFLLQYYVPNLTETAPRWVYFCCAVCMFNYQTLDAIDGKQARRTRSSSPLGELFDHCCDAVASVLIAFQLAATLQTGVSSLTLIIFWLNIIPFFLCNWENSCTGLMRFGVLGVTEGQFLVMLIFLFTGLFGPEVWTEVQVFPGNWSIRSSVLFIVIPAALYQCASSIFMVWMHCLTETKNYNQALNQLKQFAWFIVLSTVWIELLMVQQDSLIYAQPRLIYAIVGCLFTLQISYVIVCHVTLDKYPESNFLIHPLLFYLTLVAAILAAVTPIFALNQFHWSNTLMHGAIKGFACCVFLSYLTYITLSIRQITTFLGIGCFSIRK